MLQNIIILVIVVVAVFFLIRHFKKGGTDCCKTEDKNKCDCGCNGKQEK
ncbi:MAG: hypothetical protein LBD46_06900 [Endomicrobium sp.]|nr:hypothetical protein [Endomicrobium sp.]